MMDALGGIIRNVDERISTSWGHGFGLDLFGLKSQKLIEERAILIFLGFVIGQFSWEIILLQKNLTQI